MSISIWKNTFSFHHLLHGKCKRNFNAIQLEKIDSAVNIFSVCSLSANGRLPLVPISPGNDSSKHPIGASIRLRYGITSQRRNHRQAWQKIGIRRGELCGRDVEDAGVNNNILRIRWHMNDTAGELLHGCKNDVTTDIPTDLEPYKVSNVHIV